MTEMNTDPLLDVLGYRGSPHFLRTTEDFARFPDFAHIFRTASTECSLAGVYALSREADEASNQLVPVVFVCRAHSEEDAKRIHRIVWNQNVVPFLLIHTPYVIRLYSGFSYNEAQPTGGLLAEVEGFGHILEALKVSSAAIDDGTVWGHWGDRITPESRVDWNLLDNLRKLDQWLRRHELDKSNSHALIGKYVYLRYLRDRGILSDRKLAKWRIRQEEIFGRHASLLAFWHLIDELDSWLNGSVFPLSQDNSSILPSHLQKVAGVFSGDDPSTGQQHLDFSPYDFSHIPIETLSVIYQQFLHVPDDDHTPTQGKRTGAYYTPMPLVSFVLTAMHAKHPLCEGMRILDPSCGSGAFLVQCYRRLIEQRCLHTGRTTLLPSEARQLVQDHIFGVEKDPDACRIAELSLMLTLLDYVKPPDLEYPSNFQLPLLRNHNIFEADFFDEPSVWSSFAIGHHFDWIVGNPPWVELTGRLNAHSTPVWDWMQARQMTHPTGGNQVAEAFAWKAAEHVSEQGAIALVMPAMTLFKNESTRMRSAFFRRMRVWSVANLANFAYVLFGGRSHAPAAVFFYGNRSQEDAHAHESILVYSPLVANQQANRSSRQGKRKQVWNIVVNASELREIPTADVLEGEALPWKVAMWGSLLDGRVLRKAVHNCAASLGAFARTQNLNMQKGAELRSESSRESKTYRHDLVGQRTVDFNRLRKRTRLFVIPENALIPIPDSRAYVRTRGGTSGLEVNKPPHVIVDASRRFAVYSEQPIVVPGRQVGISGAWQQASVLKALAAYLNSDFVKYHQFLVSPQWGIAFNEASLDTLRLLPLPEKAFSPEGIRKLGYIYDELAMTCASEEEAFHEPGRKQARPCETVLKELNEYVYDKLGFTEPDRILVEDLVHVRMGLIKGKVSKDALLPPDEGDMKAYIGYLASLLDGFVKDNQGVGHVVIASYDESSAMISICLAAGKASETHVISLRSGDRAARQLAQIKQRLRAQHSQWVYFERDLRVYQKSKMLLLKPMQKLVWTKGRAIVDAVEVIADMISGEEG